MSVQQYDDAQVGPQKAVNFVERQPDVNRLSSANVIAPVPVVQDGVLYWHTKVVPESDSGVIYTAFVNAQSGEVTLLDGTEQVYAFLSEEEVDEIQNETESQSQTQVGTRVTVVVTNENGQIQGTTNVTVPRGGSAQIQIEDQAQNRTTSSTENS